MPLTATFDTGKILEYQAKGLSNVEIGELCGVSEGTVRDHLRRFRSFSELRQGVDDFRQTRAEIFAGLQAKLLAAISTKLDDDKELAKLSPYAMTGMMALIYDKERLEMGKSSSNIAVLSGIITKSEESGDTALRKLSVNAPKLKEVSPISDTDVVPDSGTRK